MKKVKVIVCLLAVLCIVATIGYLFVRAKRRIYPEDGIWYCEELQIYLNFGYNEVSKAIIDGEEVDCTACYMDASELITINRVYDGVVWNDQTVFEGLFVSLQDNELVLCERYTKMEYVFVRIE